MIDPRAEQHPAGLAHIVRHELVHVAHGERFGADAEATKEWLVDQVALLVAQKRAAEAERDEARAQIDTGCCFKDDGCAEHRSAEERATRATSERTLA